ncbi:MAG: pilus assembly protein, partial [Thermoguttaceae bacterium]|nr:pilus assembly protein [Thermoguttaceae bacterium]
MHRAALSACLPWFGLLVLSLVVLRLLVHLNRARFDWRRLVHLHGDQDGSVQSLSFVLTLPVFLWVILFIVQVSQLMIATVVVHYAAYAAARSAVVWIPQRVASHGVLEWENCIPYYELDREAAQQLPITNPADPNYGPTDGGMTFVVQPGSVKHQKIAWAAVLACLPICPSRSLGLQEPPFGAAAADAMRRAYDALAPNASAQQAVLTRLRNKLAYAAGRMEIERWDEAAGDWVYENVPLTDVQIRFYHPNYEPPLVTHYVGPDFEEFRQGMELGWQDHVTVTVTHQLALLPGPGRLLASRVLRHPGHVQDAVSRHIRTGPNVYVYPLTATATLG